MNSKIFNLNWKDFLKGLVVATVAGVAVFLKKSVYDTMVSGQELVLSVQTLQTIGIVALYSGLGYIVKQLFTDDEGKLLGKI